MFTKPQGVEGLPKLIPLLLAALVVQNAAATTRYVDLNSPSPTQPYTSWPTAATNIQDAVDAAEEGDLVLVNNGVYRTGGRVVFGGITNRVAVTKPITLQSVNGAIHSLIEGNGPMGSNAVRCVYLTNQAQLIGFTLTNGATLSSGNSTYECSGGGVWCEPLATPSTLIPIISNCVIVANAAGVLGGGGYNGFYERCMFKANTAITGGGGVAAGYLRNCLIIENRAFSSGGGGSGIKSADNCTIVGNSVSGSGAGGVDGVPRLRNCIIYYNTNAFSPDRFENYSGGTLIYCNTIPKPAFGASTSAITNAPLFVDPLVGDFQLQPRSPCINSGINLSTMGDHLDFQGDPRIVAETIDIGAYEFQTPTSALSYAWAQQYGLPSDGSADFTDDDGDGMNNYGEWRSDTIPTNTLSVLRMVSATNSPTGVKVTWQSVFTRLYWLERATNLSSTSPFQTIATNRSGGASATTFTDTSATNAGPYFYRVGVQ
ncbi:MAG: hypothetical protein IT579_11800 [Verrucomicrobia subdivision 3 bacterium]|nr:hypothetical protein [Limisphaerales bacterium]